MTLKKLSKNFYISLIFIFLIFLSDRITKFYVDNKVKIFVSIDTDAKLQHEVVAK